MSTSLISRPELVSKFRRIVISQLANTRPPHFVTEGFCSIRYHFVANQGCDTHPRGAFPCAVEAGFQRLPPPSCHSHPALFRAPWEKNLLRRTLMHRSKLLLSLFAATLVSQRADRGIVCKRHAERQPACAHSRSAHPLRMEHGEDGEGRRIFSGRRNQRTMLWKSDELRRLLNPESEVAKWMDSSPALDVMSVAASAAFSASVPLILR